MNIATFVFPDGVGISPTYLVSNVTGDEQVVYYYKHKPGSELQLRKFHNSKTTYYTLP